MITKTILAALLTTCGIADQPDESPDAPEQPDAPNLAPLDTPEIEYFCCAQLLDPDSGKGCVTIAQSQSDQCSTVLTCDLYYKENGITYCK